MEGLSYFEEMASGLNNPEVRKWKEAGKRVVGTVCSNIPEEVIHAAGMLPLRLRASGLQDTSKADAQLHLINCSYTRSVLEILMRGDVDFLDGLVATNTCDHMLRLAGEIQDKAKKRKRNNRRQGAFQAKSFPLRLVTKQRFLF